APLSMFETVVALKPPDQWRKGMTWDKLLAEVNANIKTPGMANIFWMPIQTRTEMLTTGFRSVLGVKVFGPDLGEIQKLAVQIERELAGVPNTRSAFAERTVGGYFLDFDVNREAKMANRSVACLSISHRAILTATCAPRRSASRTAFSSRLAITFSGRDNSNTSSKRCSDSRS